MLVAEGDDNSLLGDEPEVLLDNEHPVSGQTAAEEVGGVMADGENGLDSVVGSVAAESRASSPDGESDLEMQGNASEIVERQANREPPIVDEHSGTTRAPNAAVDLAEIMEFMRALDRKQEKRAEAQDRKQDERAETLEKKQDAVTVRVTEIQDAMARLESKLEYCPVSSVAKIVTMDHEMEEPRLEMIEPVSILARMNDHHVVDYGRVARGRDVSLLRVTKICVGSDKTCGIALDEMCESVAGRTLVYDMWDDEKISLIHSRVTQVRETTDDGVSKERRRVGHRYRWISFRSVRKKIKREPNRTGEPYRINQGNRTYVNWRESDQIHDSRMQDSWGDHWRKPRHAMHAGKNEHVSRSDHDPRANSRLKGKLEVDQSGDTRMQNIWENWRVPRSASEERNNGHMSRTDHDPRSMSLQRRNSA